MTIKELYDWAAERKLENAEMVFWEQYLEEYMYVFMAEEKDENLVLLLW